LNLRLIVNKGTAEAPLYIVLRRSQHSMDVPDFGGKQRSGTWTSAAPKGKTAACIPRSKGKYGLYRKKFASFLKNLIRNSRME